MFFKQFFDDKLAQYSYLIGCQATGEAIVIDPLRDIDQYLKTAEKENLTITKAADTHIHADYVSGLREFAGRGVKVYASSEGGPDWQYEWLIDSSYHYKLLKDGDTMAIGNIEIKAWHTPGHTPEHLSYYIIDGAASDEPMGLATGDFVFVGDVGRPDLLESAAGEKGLMKPSAKTLYQSVEKFKHVPEYLQIWPGHGSGSACGKALGAVPGSTVGYELRFNNSIRAATSVNDFVEFILEGQPEPPYYFKRMKSVNKKGPDLLKRLPAPAEVTTDKVLENAEKENTVILDTRDMNIFMKRHLPGSISCPLNKQFNTVAGCYVEADQTIYLIIEEKDIEEAVRDLIRVGLDRVAGFITPHDLEFYLKKGGKIDSIKAVDFRELDELQNNEKLQILDVRKKSEFDNGHIPGAMNIAHTRLIPHLKELPGNRMLAVHCQSGKRSGYAASFLRTRGFDVLWVYDNFENCKKITGPEVYQK
ncbi:MAG: rhodanese-like domain-containing protein [Balneolaceae bacterium]